MKYRFLALCVSAVVGCQLVSGASDIPFGVGGGATSSGEAGGTGGTGSGGGDGGAGGQGGELECVLAEDCPPVDDDACSTRQCVNAMCVPALTAEGEACNVDGVCDGLGACVECTNAYDDNCEDGVEACSNGVCASLHCINEIVDGGETDVDCGGPECAPCADDALCMNATDCVSGVCDGGTCVGCSTPTDCTVENTWCNNGSCVPQKQQGDSCSDDLQCATGFCTDGVCCDGACGGLCKSCITAHTGEAQGTCANITKREDPQDECALGACCEGSCAGLNLCF